MQMLIKLFHVPSGIGRLPFNISSGYGGFTANQWSNWITVYSPVLLKGILPDAHLRCWLLFVRACSILRSYVVKKQDIESADLYLLQFCRSFQQLYGADTCTPNMHLHLHIKQSILDFGPPHAFWCYAFERYNGILGSIHTNRRSIESQLMRQFCQEQELNDLILPNDPEFQSFIPKAKNSINSFPCENVIDISTCLEMARSPLSSLQSFALNMRDPTMYKLLPPYHEKILTLALSKQLQCIYEQLYPEIQISHFPLFYKEFGRAEIAEEIIGSTKRGQNSHSSSVVMSYWPGSGSKLDEIDYGRMRVGVVQFFLKHSIIIDGGANNTRTKELTHILCYVHWKKLHPHATWYGISATVCTDLYEEPDACCFMPIQRIASRCAFVKLPVNFTTHRETVFVACPIPLKYNV